MRSVLLQEEEGKVPDDALAMKYYRIRLSSGGSAVSKPSRSGW